MSKAQDLIKRIKEEEIEWVDLRFTDPKGKWQHLTMCAHMMGEDELEDGLMFDGSSIDGWKAINESDMILRPDLDSVFVDPFTWAPTCWSGSKYPASWCWEPSNIRCSKRWAKPVRPRRSSFEPT